MSMDIYREIVHLRESGKSFALATVVHTEGSTPRKAGTKMIVLPDGSNLSTLGGGWLEAQVIRKGLEALEQGSPRLLKVDLSESTMEHDQSAGKIEVFIEPVTPAYTVVILGAGNVGMALARVCTFAGFRVFLLDDRQEQLNKVAGECETCLIQDFGQALSCVEVRPETLIVIATRSHETDFLALCTALNTKAGYIGLLGSKRKKKAFFERLVLQGHSDKDLSRIYVPVGLSIGAETPEEIAVSIVAQLIRFLRKKKA